MELIFCRFEEKYTGQLVEMAIQAYSKNNPHVVSGSVTQEYLRQQTKVFVSEMLRIQELFNKENKTNISFSNAYVTKEGKLVAAGFRCDLSYFIREFKGLPNDVLLREVKQIDLRVIPKMSTAVHMRFLVHKDWHKMGIQTTFMNLKAKYLVSQGYYQGFSISTNRFNLNTTGRNGIVWKDVTDYANEDKLMKLVLINDFRHALKNTKNPTPKL